ncbi:MAG: DNA-3-methyladenine glycosylase I [Acidimicrobiales bacterium]|nr:DNA-3-methyladenine glycosylase I [Acidimicrobiales bacterium]MXX43160.1 DNA-3-methyladenine glycosylase I [Acidimicrobiales bacterium]MXY02775.1 DNA-3-methyladenine glycosylase I [Acidimicrobiales bacterium]MYB82077.1 DNA-3-methyladenine glycosylase I [Acidimicrobiales bacterium]MYD34105.1 DNA-3-methyladenine glycosylase I [Acidimicrobiales bacterium]
MSQTTELPEGLRQRADGSLACWWGEGHDDYEAYHDSEWAMPVVDDIRLYEKMCLEGFQSGLSWLTILRKRENFRAAFAGFDFEAVARFGADDVERLLSDAGIVRHRGKIEATINNARAALDTIEAHGSLAAFFWSFEPGSEDRPAVVDYESLISMPSTPHSTALSKALRKLGWRFVGPTTCYALMQASGIVNDHLEGCHRRPVVEAARTALHRPT